eukprot:evm.model.scf_1089.4 EVM.evm.TU.scf_1089.4   scf_1089:49758-50006(+)
MLLSSSRKSADESLSWERERCGKLMEQADRSAQRERELEEECSRANARADEAAQSSERLSADLDALSRRRSADGEREADLQMQ